MKKRILAFILSLSILNCVPASDIKADAASRQLNVRIRYGTSELWVYGVPSTFNSRFPNIDNLVSSFYSDNFGITINFDGSSGNNGVIWSVADECKRDTHNVDAFCEHTSNLNCSNSGPYHCTNREVIRNDIFPRPRDNYNYIELYLTSIRLCVKNGSQHGSLNGVCYTTDKCIIVRDTDYTKNYYSNNIDDVAHVSATFIHEIGHLYGVSDHYNTYYGTDRDDCIWGYYHNSYDVANNRKVCDVCNNIIQQNASRFNHS